ncbi:hypothetical protein [Rhodococcus qingshengii]|uniref:hypothetical protein n=1 Tax=Rhodococcus qingshengii TaxID=334542 RepID=UPI00237CD0EC|nr:hypothetical protein [Rhodococcus qingshengii]WCT05990.1 hypothetical protein PI247_29665 [Rhodococcus qingshengii]
MVLLTDGAILVGTLVRTDIDHLAPGDAVALTYARLQHMCISPEQLAERVREWMSMNNQRRHAIV